jgi:hypothetical protein
MFNIVIYSILAFSILVAAFVLGVVGWAWFLEIQRIRRR